jgi:hypothetical protein
VHSANGLEEQALEPAGDLEDVVARGVAVLFLPRGRPRLRQPL